MYDEASDNEGGQASLRSAVLAIVDSQMAVVDMMVVGGKQCC